MERKSLFNPIILILITFISLAGIIVGVMFAANSEEAQKVMEEAVLFSRDFKAVFMKTLTVKVLWTAAFALGGISIFFIPLTLVAVFVKNYSFGFTAGCMVAVMGVKGYYITLSGIFMHNFLFLLFTLLYSTYSINKSIGCFLNRRNYEYKLRKNKIFAIITFASILLIAALSFLEAWLSLRLYEI